MPDITFVYYLSVGTKIKDDKRIGTDFKGAVKFSNEVIHLDFLCSGILGIKYKSDIKAETNGADCASPY